jgi:exo-beta-1,3-glucanase (GH17 family)
MVGVALKSPQSEETQQIIAEMQDFIPYGDVMEASVYPYFFFQHENKGDPQNLPTDWLSQIQLMAGSTPVAATETGWIADDLVIETFGADVAASAENQDADVSELFYQASALNAEFVIWFSDVDFNIFWNDVLAQDPLAQIWRDTGLYDGEVNGRPRLDTWLDVYNFR